MVIIKIWFRMKICITKSLIITTIDDMCVSLISELKFYLDNIDTFDCYVLVWSVTVCFFSHTFVKDSGT